jgi:uncharacterized protein
VKGIHQIDDPQAKETLARAEMSLKEIYGQKLCKIILFGSYARKAQETGSDIDIMVLLDMDESEISRFNDAVVSMMSDLGLRHGILPFIIEKNYDQFYRLADYVPFYRIVRDEGIEVYGR